MGNSPKSSPSFLEQLQHSLTQILTERPDSNRLLIALSGGADSMALLHGLLQLGIVPPSRLLVVHVDHGLQIPSTDWALWCASSCASLGLAFHSIRLELPAHNGEGLEAQARSARYAAIKALMRPADLLLTGHHADDQAETLLLQLLRGSGLAGLAAMPRVRPFGPGFLARPLLGIRRRDIEVWLVEQGHRWLEDPTNALPHFDRNYLRHEVMPLLQQRWPAALTTLGRSASHCAEADALLQELAQEQLAAICPKPDQLLVKPLLGLSLPRRRWLLRTWLRHNGCTLPNQARLEVMVTEVLEAKQDRQPLVGWSDWEVRRFRGLLYLFRAQSPLDQSHITPWPAPETLELPDNGRLRLEWREQGLPAELWQQEAVSVRYRPAGQGDGAYCAGRFRSLKKLVQGADIPPWQRDRLPLVFAGDELVAAASLGICLKPQPGPGWWPIWDNK